ncbi:hypothetical protein ACSX1A_03985 [Pontibacter sp. MBLB2868]|uniref:hypothetical protein n=1 Tax=Pontibacter sp. MBLB2868 TaxID=3451555 RepID=UPI003F754CC8
MIGFLRQLFGLRGVTGNRTVVGSPENLAVKDLPYIRESNRRLEELQELYSSYKGTPHAQKIFTVYEKSKRIHAYLVSRNRAHELELFHLKHTDHFLSTFTAIIDVHQHRYPHVQHQDKAPAPPKPAQRPEVVGRTFVLGPFRRESKEVKAVQMQSRETNQRIFVEARQVKADVTHLPVPDISIDTFSRIVYMREDISDGFTTNEIGYTSSAEEKEAFVNYVSALMGITGVDYVGNAMVYLPVPAAASEPAEMVPVIHWNGSPYALSLEEKRLYAVNTFRKSR